MFLFKIKLKIFFIKNVNLNQIYEKSSYFFRIISFEWFEFFFCIEKIKENSEETFLFF